MKSILQIALALSLTTAALADDGTLGAISTTNGRHYSSCRIINTEPDGVTFRHSRGIAKVLYLQMAGDLRDQLGYDADKAAKYQEGLKVKREMERQRSIAREQRIQRVMQAALTAASYFQSQTGVSAEPAPCVAQSYPVFAPATGLFRGAVWGLPSGTTYGADFGQFHGFYPWGYGFGQSWSHNRGHVERPLGASFDINGRIIHREVSHLRGCPTVRYQQQGVTVQPFGVPGLGAAPVYGTPPAAPVVRGGSSRPVSAR